MFDFGLSTFSVDPKITLNEKSCKDFNQIPCQSSETDTNVSTPVREGSFSNEN